MARAFPTPSSIIVGALDELRLAAESRPKSARELRRLAELPRPWDPPTCPPELRRLVYAWLDEVAAWINEEHTWRVERVIPICWVDHPHIVHELATVACLRWEAEYAVSAAVLEEWHRYALPMFLDRVGQRIGSTGCPPGRHQPNPGATRNGLYRGEPEAAGRRRRRVTETEGDG